VLVVQVRSSTQTASLVKVAMEPHHLLFVPQMVAVVEEVALETQSGSLVVLAAVVLAQIKVPLVLRAKATRAARAQLLAVAVAAVGQAALAQTVLRQLVALVGLHQPTTTQVPRFRIQAAVAAVAQPQAVLQELTQATVDRVWRTVPTQQQIAAAAVAGQATVRLTSAGTAALVRS
jgi:hypothetical protein